MRQPALVLACILSVAIVQSQAQTIDTTTARTQGSSMGQNLNSSIYTTITNGSAPTTVPNYNANPSQTQYFQGGNGVPLTPGAARVAGCTAQSDVECQAVNLLQLGKQTRPQITIDPTDPLIGRAHTLTSNPTTVLGDIFSTYQNCSTTTTTIPATYETQVCNEFATNENVTCTMGQEVVVDPNYLYKCLETIQSQSNATCTMGVVIQVDPDYNYQCEVSTPVETLTCMRGFSAQVGVDVSEVVQQISHDSQVPEWSSGTFTETFTIDGAPSAFALQYYRADNYGQLWINGQLVYQNVPAGWPDIRDTTVRVVPGLNGHWLFTPSNTRLAPAYFETGCSGACLGVMPNLDITSYMVEGDNTITIVCVNSTAVGACNAKIVGTTRRLVFLGSLVDNQCAALEQRSQ